MYKKIFLLLNPKELQPLDLWKELKVINKIDAIKMIKNSLSDDRRCFADDPS